MNKLPLDIQSQFFELFNEEISIEVFEQWLYTTAELEVFFEAEDYIDLISLDFKSRHVIHEMKKIADKYMDYGEFEKRKLYKLLNDLISKNNNFAKSLIATYHMYCHGYSFLDNIAFGYGITFANDFFDFDDWTKLSEEEKTKRVDAIYSGVKPETEKVVKWLDEKNVILTGETNELGHYKYIDNRTALEKIPTGYSVIKLDE